MSVSLRLPKSVTLAESLNCAGFEAFGTEFEGKKVAGSNNTHYVDVGKWISQIEHVRELLVCGSRICASAKTTDQKLFMNLLQNGPFSSCSANVGGADDPLERTVEGMSIAIPRHGLSKAEARKCAFVALCSALEYCKVGGAFAEADALTFAFSELVQLLRGSSQEMLRLCLEEQVAGVGRKKAQKDVTVRKKILSCF